jgi:hypothetical protein
MVLALGEIVNRLNAQTPADVKFRAEGSMLRIVAGKGTEECLLETTVRRVVLPSRLAGDLGTDPQYMPLRHPLAKAEPHVPKVRPEHCIQGAKADKRGWLRCVYCRKKLYNERTGLIPIAGRCE